MGPDHAAYFEEVEARFEGALDFDLGLEEEFQVLDRETLDLIPGFEDLRDAAPERLKGRIAGELLRSEIEVSTPRTLHFGQAAKQLLLNRAELFALADREGYALGATGTHPFSAWKDQQIIDTPHYRLVEDRLKYVAWRNNTWAAHVHVGVRGCDRAVAVCDALRPTCRTSWRSRPTRRSSKGCGRNCTRRVPRRSCACSRAAASRM